MLTRTVNAIILLLGSVCYFIFYTRLSTRTLYVGGLVCIWPVLIMIGVLEVLKRRAVIRHQGGS